MTVLALTGAKASVIGGTPAAAVVLAGEVRRRADAEVRELQIDHRHRDALDVARREAHQRHLGAVAREFDATHSIDRAVSVGSVDEVVAPAELRSRIAALLRADRDRGRQA
jgi:acetyl-CoA carboxylase carboxyltransferase component